MINYQNLDVEYDSVIVFDLLSDEERKKHQITESLETFFKQKNAPITAKYLSGKNELLSYFQQLLQEAQQGKNFMFHFVSHGNDSGIGFKHSGEFISWSELTDILTKINEASHNTLVLNLTSCFGLHGIKTVNPFKTGNPFFGLIGYAEKLKILVGKQANEIFYDSVISGLKINQAVDKLQADLNDKKFHCITSQGYSHLKMGNKK